MKVCFQEILLYKLYCLFNNPRILTFFRDLNLIIMTTTELPNCPSCNLMAISYGLAFLIFCLKIVKKISFTQQPVNF